MIADIEKYFTSGCGRCARFDTADCSALIWSEGVKRLREICVQSGLTETLKWGQPCYQFAERNVAIIGALRTGFSLSFFEAGLLNDPENNLERPGPNSPIPSVLRFESLEQLGQMSELVVDFLGQAKHIAQRGLRAPKVQFELPVPDELVEVLNADPELSEAFFALTPGRRKSYLINLNQAKMPATRVSRIAKFRAKIIAGKGAMER